MIAAGREEHQQDDDEGRDHADLGRAKVERLGRHALPGSWWRTAEISRSMYMAASTIAIAPTTAQPQPMSKMPSDEELGREALEPGTASAITPVVIRIVASTGRPQAMPPRSRSSPVLVRRSIAPASRKSAAEIARG